MQISDGGNIGVCKCNFRAAMIHLALNFESHDFGTICSSGGPRYDRRNHPGAERDRRPPARVEAAPILRVLAAEARESHGRRMHSGSLGGNPAFDAAFYA